MPSPGETEPDDDSTYLAPDQLDRRAQAVAAIDLPYPDLAPPGHFRAALTLFMPIIFPIAMSVGIDPIVLGVLVTVMIGIGLVTPPVGTVLNVVAGATNSTMTKVVKGVGPFLVSHAVILLLMIFFPALVIVPAKWFGG